MSTSRIPNGAFLAAEQTFSKKLKKRDTDRETQRETQREEVFHAVRQYFMAHRKLRALSLRPSRTTKGLL